jgi:hypothetical protein
VTNSAASAALGANLCRAGTLGSSRLTGLVSPTGAHRACSR